MWKNKKKSFKIKLNYQKKNLLQFTVFSFTQYSAYHKNITTPFRFLLIFLRIQICIFFNFKFKEICLSIYKIDSRIVS